MPDGVVTCPTCGYGYFTGLIEPPVNCDQCGAPMQDDRVPGSMFMYLAVLDGGLANTAAGVPFPSDWNGHHDDPDDDSALYEDVYEDSLGDCVHDADDQPTAPCGRLCKFHTEVPTNA